MVWLGRGKNGTADNAPKTSISTAVRLFVSSPSAIASAGSAIASKIWRPARSLRRQSTVTLSRVPKGGKAAMNRVSTAAESRLRSIRMIFTLRSGKVPQLSMRSVTRTESPVVNSPCWSNCNAASPSTKSGLCGTAICCAGSPIKFIPTSPSSLEGRTSSSVILPSARLCPKASAPFSNICRNSAVLSWLLMRIKEREDADIYAIAPPLDLLVISSARLMMRGSQYNPLRHDIPINRGRRSAF